MTTKYDYCKSKMNVSGDGFEYTTELGDKVFLSHDDLANISNFKEFSTCSNHYIHWLKYKIKNKASD